MLKHVTVALDTLQPDTWTRHEVEDLGAFLKEHFGERFPPTARIYHHSLVAGNDVTPVNEKEVEYLFSLPGPFYVWVYPGWAYVPYIIGALLAVAATLLIKPTIAAPPIVTQRNEQTPSPNNGLSDRQNTPRINGRIPDIYGQVRSTPDLIASPYKIFENGREVEYAYMCVGRGAYDVSDIRDGDTLCANIVGASVDVYAPYTSPNSGAPQLRIGVGFRSPVLNTRRSNSINGQVLRPPNDATLVGDKNIRFVTPNMIVAESNSNIDFTKYFAADDVITVTDAIQAGAGAVNGPSNLNFYGTAAHTLNFAPLLPSTFDGGGFLVFSVDGPNATLPLGIVVGAHITVHQHVNPDSGLKEIFTTTSGVLTHVKGSAANMEGTYVITQIVNYFTDLVGGIAIACLLDNPAAVNANWATYWQVHPFAGAFWPVVTTELNQGTGGFDLEGAYTALSVNSTVIILDDPHSVASDWSVIDSQGSSGLMSPTLSTSGQKWVGPFIMDSVGDEPTNGLFANFVALNGLYWDNGTDQTGVTITVLIEITAVDAADTPIATPQIDQVQLTGSSTLKETVLATLKSKFLGYSGRVSVRASRLTFSNTGFTGTVVDEVRWRDLYSVAPVSELNFGNVTTIACVTFATASALAVKSRKLNLLVTRKIPSRVSGNTFSTDLTATLSAADIFMAVCRDRYIGNRLIEEVDVDSVYNTIAAVSTYFGNVVATQFCYTFDNDNMSFEETVAAIADAVFCIAYRRGNVIKLSFEKRTTDSTLLFNHRNKVPGTEKRTVTFGFLNDNDGIEYTYVDPKDDSIISIFLPQAFPATNSKKVESVGVRSHLQAYFHAWRIWNKIQFQTMQIEFDATQEADLLINNDRVLVADNTRAHIQDGEVLAVNGSEITLSQVVDLTVYGAYNIFLQLYDGTTQSIVVTAGSAPNKVVLATAPLLDLVVADNTFARTTYLIVGDEEKQQTAFLLTEKSANAGLTSTVTCTNYDNRYYANDPDFTNGVIGGGGYGSSGGFTGGTGNEYPPPVVAGWIRRQSVPDKPISVAYGNGRFMVLDFSQNVSVSTDNGVTFNLVSTQPNASNHLVFGNGVWMMGGSTGSGVGVTSHVLRSTDNGATWASINTGISGPVSGGVNSLITDGAGNWVATAGGGGLSANHYAVSNDGGLTWTKPGLFTYDTAFNDAACWDGTRFVFIGRLTNAANAAVIVSTDGGLNWTGTVCTNDMSNRLSYDASSGYYMSRGGGGAGGDSVRVGNSIASFAAAADVADSLSDGGTYSCIAARGIMWAFGFSGGSAKSINHGAAWTPIPLNFSTGNGASQVAYNPSTDTFLAVGDAGETATLPASPGGPAVPMVITAAQGTGPNAGNRGYQDASFGAPMGSIVGGTFNGFTVAAIWYSAGNVGIGIPFNLTIALSGTSAPPPDNAFTSASWTDSNGSVVFNSADADIQVSSFTPTLKSWSLGSDVGLIPAATGFVAGTQYPITFA